MLETKHGLVGPVLVEVAEFARLSNITKLDDVCLVVLKVQI